MAWLLAEPTWGSCPSCESPTAQLWLGEWNVQVWDLRGTAGDSGGRQMLLPGIPSTPAYLGCGHWMDSWSRMSSLEVSVSDLPGYLGPFCPDSPVHGALCQLEGLQRASTTCTLEQGGARERPPAPRLQSTDGWTQGHDRTLGTWGRQDWWAVAVQEARREACGRELCSLLVAGISGRGGGGVCRGRCYPCYSSARVCAPSRSEVPSGPRLFPRGRGQGG